MAHYDLLILGHISKDINITLGQPEYSVGGAVVYSSVAAHNIGANIGAITKLSKKDMAALDVFGRFGVPIVYRPSRDTTSIRNTYHSEDRERRTCEALSIADPFCNEDIPEGTTAGIYYLGGLIKGEFPEAFIRDTAARGSLAIDVQGVIRVSENGPMCFKDWPEKQEILPLVRYLKTDAAEAEILTGTQDREAAANMLHGWGAQEVMVTHNSGVLVLAEGKTSFAPFTSRNLSGRTGRGDTCFASYCAWRREHSAEEACRFAAALTSLKMETPGPFQGTLEDVLEAIKERY